MARLTLDFEYEFDFQLIGIACHAPDYRLAWAMNKALEINLRKENDIDLQIDSKNTGFFSFYRYDEEENEKTYHILGNRSSVGYLVPEMKQMDFFFQYWGGTSAEELKTWLKNIKEIPFVLTAIEIDPNQLKSGANLLF